MNHRTTEPQNHRTTEPQNHRTYRSTRDIKFIFLITVILTMFSCKKDSKETSKGISNSQNYTSGLVFDIRDDINTKENEETRTILGKKRNNPFTITNMATAYNNLYGTNITEMPTTNIYIQFNPNSIEDIKILNSQIDVLYDYPLEYEVLKMGDYYSDAQGTDFPILYAILKVDDEIPNVASQILANLYLSQENLRLNAEAMRITGNANEIGKYTNIDIGDVADIDLPMVPEIIECEGINCAPKLRLISEDEESPVYEWYCHCTPPTPSSGCDDLPDSRHPGGIIRVEDTQYSTHNDATTYLPVRRVKVITKDNWFWQHTTYTDANGCWSIGHEYYGNSWMWVKYRNSRCSVRGPGNGLKVIWQWATSIKQYVGENSGPNFSDSKVNYHLWTISGSHAHLYWGAATVNNSVEEFYVYANNHGINPPPNYLDVFLAHNRRDGFSLMGAQYTVSNSVLAQIMQTPWFTASLSVVVGLVGSAAAIAYLPEVQIGIDFNKSDKLKRLVYHELAHSSHYTKVGIWYWTALASSEILANGHGNTNSPGAGRIALCESWAEHIARTIAHETYGLNNSIDISSNPSVNTYITWLEKQKNEVTNHIPIGYYYDLQDGVNITETATDKDWLNGNSDIIIDGVSGLSNNQLFSLLNSNIKSPSDFNTALINSGFIQAPNNQVDITNLFNSY